jgi:hypothetical protein
MLCDVIPVLAPKDGRQHWALGRNPFGIEERDSDYTQSGNNITRSETLPPLLRWLADVIIHARQLAKNVEGSIYGSHF